ncbi:hypothetical protein [uncultured Halopseudomonas sp.]|uniref:hypothetical protein n=1 Tax=uncultured Halopseudomonas sp. TaxID=2901193 RepID=UPI0030ECE72F|tara:strand:+ start:219627 stop:220277 length:651 start_codon:yes stop_codon:yes gene_type:complete
MPVSRFSMHGVSAALALFALSGCAWLPQSGGEGSLRTSGQMYLTDEGAQLETCSGAVHPLRVNEELRALFERVAEPAQNVLFVELRGQLLDDNSIRPDTVLRMGAKGNGCTDSVAAQSQWVTTGERPDWLVRIAPSGLQVTTLGEEWQPVITEQLPDGRRGFRTLEGEPVELWVYPQPCFSRLNGYFYQYTARLLTSGESFAGCAYPGYLTGSPSS